jgi:outer membrane receptor protein involved in Fe transport
MTITRTLLFSTFALTLPLASRAALRDSVVISEVVVTGTKAQTDPRFLPFTVQEVSRQALTQNHQQSVLPTLMEQVPGLMVTSRSMLGYGVSTGAAGNISVRGLSGSSGQMLVLVDGHPQYSGIYGHPLADSYQTLLADHVEVVTTPSSLLYGSNAMGGVINIITRQAHTDGNSLDMEAGAGSYGTVQAEVSDQYRRGPFSLTAAGQFARTDNHRPHNGFEQYGGLLKATYDLSRYWDLYADVNLTHWISRYPGSVDSPVYGAAQWITRGSAALAVDNHYGRTQGQMSLFSDFGRHKIDDGTSDPTTTTNRYFRSRDNILGLSAWQAFQWIRGGQFTVGLDYQHIYGRAFYTSKETGETLDTPNKQSGHSHRNEIAGYVDLRQDLWRWLTINAGVRVDHHSVTGTEWVPQAGLVVRPSALGEIKAVATKGFRNPTMRELYLYPTSTEDLRPERLWSYELSYHGRTASRRFTYGAAVYYMNGDNLIQVVNRKNVNTGKIENTGVELEAAYALGSHWRLNTNHSWMHLAHPIVVAPQYKGYLGAECTYGRFRANAGLMQVSGLYKQVGSNEQTENFTLLNATVNYDVTSALTLWVRGDNLLAQKYEINAGYPMPRATFMAGVRVRI